MKDAIHLPIVKLSSLLKRREISPVELTDAFLSRIDALDGRLNAFITVTVEEARRAARKAEGEILRGDYRGPLHGIPFSIKDLFETEGVRTTAASKILLQNVPKRSATAVNRLLQAGAILLGKTNLQEFARGPTGVDSHFGPTRNPWDLARISGGSSSGSAVSVSASLAAGTLGTDTGGSVRIPAALCGIVGLRPTYGRVSLRGVIPLGPSLDTVGPLSRCVEDAALILQAISGPDAEDPTTRGQPMPALPSRLREDITGMRLGVASGGFFPGLEPEVEGLVREAIQKLASLGAEVEEVEVPFAEYASVTYMSVVGPESALYHREHLRSRRQDYTGPTADFFEVGMFVPGYRYVQGLKACGRFIREMAEVFKRVDALLTPTVPIVAPKIEASSNWTPLFQCTMPFSLVGVPALSIPCGFTQGGLPVGLQIVGRWWDEGRILGVGRAYEEVTEWHTRPPSIG